MGSLSRLLTFLILMADQRIPSAVYKALVRYKLRKMYRECGAYSHVGGGLDTLISITVKELEHSLVSQEWFHAAAGLNESDKK